MFEKIDFETIFRYCQEYDLYRYYYSANDNFNVTIQALECDMAAELDQFASDGKTLKPYFEANCVDFSRGDQKPLIYVNNPYTYFNVTGALTVKNLKFSGINAMAKSSKANEDLSIFP
jgi:hypothetical protein